MRSGVEAVAVAEPGASEGVVVVLTRVKALCLDALQSDQAVATYKGRQIKKMPQSLKEYFETIAECWARSSTLNRKMLLKGLYGMMVSPSSLSPFPSPSPPSPLPPLPSPSRAV